MSAAAGSPTRPARRHLVGYDTYTLVFGLVYAALATNIALVVAGAPLVVGLVTTDPARSWPALALVAPLAAPGLVAAFAVFGAFTADSTAPILRTFWRAWRRCFRKALAIAAMVVAGVVVTTVDIRAVWEMRIGALAVPVFVVLTVLSAVTGLYALVLLAARPDARLRDLLRAGLYLSVRRWYLTAFSVVVVGLGLTLFAAKPALALGLAAAPLLYVVWANTRFAARPALGESRDERDGAAVAP